MKKLQVDLDSLKRNFGIQGDFVAAEPLYILLAAKGHPDAHEAVRTVVQQARGTGQTLRDVLNRSTELRPYLDQFTPAQAAIVADPTQYIGIAAKKAADIASR